MRDAIYDRIAVAQGYHNMKEMLDDLYSTKDMPQNSIAELVGCSIPTLRTLRQQYGIEDKIKEGCKDIEIARYIHRDKSVISRLFARYPRE